MIEIKNVSAGYGDKLVLDSISLCLHPSRIIALTGPNGSGKSTLFQAMTKQLPVNEGDILYDGISISSFTQRQLARRVAYMPQNRNVPNSTALRMVLHGRFPYLSYPRKYSKEDQRIAQEALRMADAEGVASEYLPELSGGQRQKVYLAMALAQDTETILMDEPITFLDIRHQLSLMRLAGGLATHKKQIIMVLHDLRLAMQYADEIVVLDHGKIASAGTPEEILEQRVIDSVFGIRLCRFATDSGWQYYYG